MTSPAADAPPPPPPAADAPPPPAADDPPQTTREHQRLADSPGQDAPWRTWGPYLSGRQWGTVREDYSADGDAWAAFPFDQAHVRAFRWGEDGIAGLTDRYGFLNVALALWNEHDDRLKERFFGLTNPQGNPGEDVKEYWWHLDATPTHSWAQVLYRYPPARLPLRASRRRISPARTARRRDRTDRHRPARRQPVLRRRRHPRQGRGRRHPHRDHGDQSRSRTRAAAPAAARVVPQHLVMGPG